jgi:pyruvate formate lyase activating enzyme
VPLHFTAFHPDWKMLNKPPTPPATLTKARRIARAQGLNHVYTGNIHDPSGQSTYCPSCEALVIGRDWYDLTVCNLSQDGHCLSCGTPCAGIFAGMPGTWGGRRRAVRIPAFAP